MSEKILRSRIPQKTDITANWNTSTLVLMDGEIGVEKIADGSRKFKIGDGINRWNALPYATKEGAANILDGIAVGSVRTISSTIEDVNYKLGTASFSEGFGTKASGNYSHAEGWNTTASGAFSFAGGRETIASGSNSFSEGTQTTASGLRSHAAGWGTIANGENQFVIGKYNIQDDNNVYAFIIGSGTSTSRKNIFTIDWTGVAQLNGKNLATEEYVGNNGGKIDTIKVNDVVQSITNKSVNITVPTLTSQLTNNSGFLVSNDLITHNTSNIAHNDIREEISELSTTITNLLDSDDTTLDQMSEIVAYIKNNKGLIDGVTTSKINVSDIANDLTTDNASKVLSAAQGVVLKGLVDNKSPIGHNHDDKYLTIDKAYVHPIFSTVNMGFYKVRTDASGHIVEVQDVAKTDITKLGIPGQDTTYEVVTQTTNGLMSFEDKIKLDGLGGNTTETTYGNYAIAFNASEDTLDILYRGVN